MKLKSLVRAASALAMVAAATSASAALQVLDGWELVTPIVDVKNIGRLNLVSGTATVNQEINGLGQAFVGAKFTETGQIFSLSYTKENTVGAGDSGSPSILGDALTIGFSDVAGVVTALNGTGGFKYNFTSGNFTLSGGGGVYATGSIIGLGGNTGATAIIGGVNGDSTLLAQILNVVAPTFDLKDSTGTSLLPQLAAGQVLFEAVTNNNVTNVIGAPGACVFDATKICSSFNVASAGDAYLVQVVPEPASLALAGLALFGVAGLTRRNKKA